MLDKKSGRSFFGGMNKKLCGTAFPLSGIPIIGDTKFVTGMIPIIGLRCDKCHTAPLSIKSVMVVLDNLFLAHPLTRWQLPSTKKS